MSVSIANVNSTTDTFQVWLDKTNQALDKLSTVVVTSAANSSGGVTTGNVALVGILNANVFAVGTQLRGGSVASSANLTISSNVSFTGANVTANVSTYNINATNVNISSTNTLISGGVLNVTSNVNFQSNTLFINAAGRLGVNTGSPDATLAVVGSMNVSSTSKFAGNVVFQSNVSLSSNLSISLTGAPTTGYIFFGTGGSSLSYNGARYLFSGANAEIDGALTAAGITSSANITLTAGSLLVGNVAGSSNTCARTIIAGNYIVGGGTLTGDVSVGVNAASAATASVIVARDANGSFSANTITANLTGIAAVATTANNLTISNTVFAGAIAATANTVVARDTNASITANVFIGVATTARYADLAEKYTTDEKYPTGTVLTVSSADGAECTKTNSLGAIVVGVISEKPAFLMNAEAPGQAVALRGRVPVRVVGSIKKGDPLVAYINGTGTLGGSPIQFKPFAVALETNLSEDEKLVECIIL